ncbi:MAG: hypothetical protein KF799_05690 [Bdellovibrionales bacterium]|nr:hypothetical protein [Bdellovibrionales bacterium]
MNHLSGLILFSLLSMSLAPLSEAQVLRTRTALPKWAESEENRWSGYLRYNVASDYAQSEQPRVFVQALGGGARYEFNENWSMTGDVALRMDTVNGQVEKNPEETHAEVLNPSTAIELDYEKRFADTHSYTTFVHGEPLWDEPSRMEGYKGIVGFGAALSLGFFKKRYVISQVLDISELLNTYDYSLGQNSNPDMFYTYKMSHSVRLYRTFKLSYSFGLKLTRALDASSKYAYNNTIMISQTWNSFSFALAYDNGGFTDDGSVSLWYIDEHRRIAQFKVGYSF